MKIARIAVHGITLPLNQPYKLASGRLIFSEPDSTLVRMETNDGLVGGAFRRDLHGAMGAARKMRAGQVFIH